MWSPNGSRIIFVNQDYPETEPKDAHLSIVELELRKLLGHSERLKDRPDKEISELSSMSIVKEMIFLRV